LEGVPVLIYQLFYNLINNSLKFSRPENQPHILIASSPIKYQGSEYVQISITDNGIGFDQQYEKRIFNTFTRLNSKDKYEGTGLGLALCKKIAERHHGQISATGEKNKGAIFTILLPLTQAERTI
jgi:signal transduction histidine kinase